MQTKRSFFKIFLIALASAALVFAASTQSDAGWYKKAKKAAKKAQHNVEKAAKNINKEANRFQANVHAESQRFNTNLAREGGRLAGDVSREAKRFGGDISVEGKKFGGDVSTAGKKLLSDSSAQSKRGISFGSFKLGENMAAGQQQLGYNLTRGERNLTHNIDRGTDNFNKNVFGIDSSGFSFLGKLGIAGVNALTYPYYTVVTKDQLRTGLFGDGLAGGPIGAFDRLGRNIGAGGDQVRDAVSDEGHRAQERVFGSPKVTDLDKSDKDQESPTGKVANALTKKKGKPIDAPESSDTPVAIFRAETDTGIGDSTGGSDTISRERTTTSQGSSTGSSSESSGLGGSQTTGKKESTSTQSTGGPKVGGGPTGRKR